MESTKSASLGAVKVRSYFQDYFATGVNGGLAASLDSLNPGFIPESPLCSEALRASIIARRLPFVGISVYA